jgi:Fe-S cluster assembly protein SufD
VTPLRTKAEQGLAQQMTGSEGVRAEAGKAFALSGLPHRKLEAWKYTDLQALLSDALPAAKPFTGKTVDAAVLAEALGRLGMLDCIQVLCVDGRVLAFKGETPKRVTIEPLVRSPLRNQAVTGEGATDPMLALGTGLATDGVALTIAADVRLTKPLHLVFLATSTDATSTAVRNVIRVGDGAEVTILESHVGARAVERQSHAVTQLQIGHGARVQHLQLLGQGRRATHLGTWAVDLAAKAQYSAFHMTESPALARNQLFVSFRGEGSSFAFNAAFLGRGQSHTDTTMVIDHAVPKCTSRELVKGVLDEDARGVFQGKVIVRPDAQKSDGKQMAKALLLSPNAEFDSKPELEIYADDVVCGHGSTVAELDQDQVFYLRARGIPEPTARALLTEAFAAEVIDTIEHEPIRETLRARLQAWLGREAAA